MPEEKESFFMRRWNACMKDPECRARLAQVAVYASMVYTLMGFVVIMLIVTGIVRL